MRNTSIYRAFILTLLLTSTPVVALAQTLTGRVLSIGNGDILQVTTCN